MNKIIAIVGMTGSGKTEVAQHIEKKGYQFLRFGQITLDIVKERGLEPTEENEKVIRENVRKEHGMGAYATLNIPKIDKLLIDGPVVVDGLYSWEEYKILKEKYQDQLVTISILSRPKSRYERLEKRTLEKDDINLRKRPASKEQAMSRDFAEIENIQKAGPIAMADNYIVNDKTLEYLYQETDKIIEELK